MSKKEFNLLMEQLKAINEKVDGIDARVSTLEKSSNSKTTKKASEKKSSQKKASKKTTSSQQAEKKTREEALTEKYGSKEDRSSFVALRNQVAEEFSNLGKKHEVYIPRKKYSQVLRDTVVSLNGKMNKKAVAKAFLAAAK